MFDVQTLPNSIINVPNIENSSKKIEKSPQHQVQSNFGLHFGSPQIQILVPSMLVPLLAAELTACSTRRQEGTVRHLLMEK